MRLKLKPIAVHSDKAINNIGLIVGVLFMGVLLGAAFSGVAVALICKRHSKAR